MLNDQPNWVTTTTAGTYTSSIWVRGDAAGALIKINIREMNGSTVVKSRVGNFTLTTAWQKITVVAHDPLARLDPRSPGIPSEGAGPPGNMLLRRRRLDRQVLIRASRRVSGDSVRLGTFPTSKRACAEPVGPGRLSIQDQSEGATSMDTPESSVGSDGGV